MALPSVTIKVDVGVVGHAFLTLDDGNGNIITRGFYPEEIGLTGPGMVRDDADHPYDWSKTITVSQDQYDAMKRYITQVESSTQDQYGVLGNNCAEFVKDVLAVGSVNHSHNGVHPSLLTNHPEIELLKSLGGGD